MRDIKVFATNIPPFEVRDLLINSDELKAHYSIKNLIMWMKLDNFQS